MLRWCSARGDHHARGHPASGILEGSGPKATEEDLNPLEAHEKAMVVDALKKANWVQKDAARILGISRRVMHYKIRKFNIELEKGQA
jgi:transcriptional regulator with GAF, ATPase, and Fis domain